jgi:hypothetical protein
LAVGYHALSESVKLASGIDTVRVLADGVAPETQLTVNWTSGELTLTPISAVLAG